MIAPIRLPQPHAMPGIGRLLRHLTEGHPLAFMLHIARESPRVQQGHKPMDVRKRSDEEWPVRVGSIQPGNEGLLLP